MSNSKDWKERLVGRKVTGVQIDMVGQHFFRFDTDEGMIVLEALGDCCSETWFADLIAADCLIGQTVSAVEDVELPPPCKKDHRSRQEEDVIYGIKIFTGRGQHAFLIFRNSSNGYYGGCVSQATPAQWADVKWQPVTEDMSW